ncbi:MAG: hypothetical protein LBE62_05360 [Azonexus sp.]|jgi:hypothetical protein|nr:hypothetical protein [Azonexus sp.]
MELDHCVTIPLKSKENERGMGTTYAAMRLGNDARPDLEEIDAEALVDTGAIPMEDMDLLIEPARQRVSVNPLAPNVPMSLAKGVSRKRNACLP